MQTVTTHLTREAEHEAFGPSPIDADNWTLTDGLRRWAVSTFGAGIDPDHEAAQFLSHFRSTGQARRNWNDEYQKWVRRSAKYASERANRPPLRAVGGTRHQPFQPPTDHSVYANGF